MSASQIFSLYFGWPAGAVYSNLVASVICVAAAYWRLRARQARLHLQALAQSAKQHKEMLTQSAEQHKDQMDLLRKQHSQLSDQVASAGPVAAAPPAEAPLMRPKIGGGM